MKPILLAGGGTGGHVFPLVALAEAFSELVPDAPLVFVGTSRGLEARVVPSRGWTLEVLPIEPIKGRSLFGAARGGMIAGAGVVRALSLVARLRPALCVSIGGYAAGPVGVASSVMGVPVALLEPNRIAGLTQRLLGPLSKRVYVGFPEAMDGAKSRALGIPLRKGFAPQASRVRAPGEPVRVLVMGGSQGAQFLNDTIPEVVANLAARGARLHVTHQAGRDKAADVSRRYGTLAVDVVEFIDDVPARLGAADLVVCRSGALTCAELCAIGRASVLVPYPFAADDHQAANAEALAKAGAAIAIRQKDATVERLVEAIGGVVEDDVTRLGMADAARARGVPDAARRIAEDLLNLVPTLASRRASQQRA